MANTNIKKWLAKKTEALETGVAEGKELKGFADLPDGTYIAMIDMHCFGESNAGNMGVKTRFLVLEGEEAGNTIMLWEDGEREDFFKWLTVKCKNCGVEDFDADDLKNELLDEKRSQDIFGLVADHTVVKIKLHTVTSKKTGQDIQNKQVIKFLPDYDIPEAFLKYDKVEPKKKDKKSKDEDDDEEGEEVEEAEVVESKKSKKSEAPVETKKSSKKVEEDDDDDDDDNDDDEGEEVKLEKGMIVSFKKGKKTLKGKVISIDGEEDEVTIKDKDKVKHVVSLDAIEDILDDETV